jgi:hypothetical protein
MDLVKLLSKLQAIGGMPGAMTEEKKPDADKDGVPDWADKADGKDDSEDKKEKANEDIFNVLKGLKAIQEASLEEDDVEEGNEFSGALTAAKAAGKEEFEVGGKKYKVNECGEMEMSPFTAPDAGIEMQPMSAIQAELPDDEHGEEMSPEVEEEKPSYTLSIQNGDSNLNMTTDIPDEIIHIMKLAGVQGKAEVKKSAPSPEGEEAGEEKEVDEAWGNTPAATNEKEPKAYGDIRDWALKGTGKGKPGYGDRRAPGQGDNPMNESTMFAEYKKFKAGK